MPLNTRSPELTTFSHPFALPVFLSFTPRRDVSGHRNPVGFLYTQGWRLGAVFFINYSGEVFLFNGRRAY